MAKLGTKKHPAIARVQTMERAQEIMALCNEHDWQVIVGIEPDKPEDISDVEKLLGVTTTKKGDPERMTPDLRRLISKVTSKTHTGSPQVGRNEMCPCGSGKKYKACCMKKRGKR